MILDNNDSVPNIEPEYILKIWTNLLKYILNAIGTLTSETNKCNF